MLTVRNVNEALSVILSFFAQGQEHHYRSISPRGIFTKELKQMPFVTRYANPMECVLFNTIRNANPFFHFFEALWVIGGRDDVPFMTYLLPRYIDYSDDHHVFHGAYGRRIYEHDQMLHARDQLKADRDTRRAIVAIWQPEYDSGYTGKDMPCNCLLQFLIRDNCLDLIVSNRSNDAIWGAYGSNAVQFSFLLNYMAMCVGLDPGFYTQVSNSLHIYPDNEPTRTLLSTPNSYLDPYRDGVVKSEPWLVGVETDEDWGHDIRLFFKLFDEKSLGTALGFKTQWWSDTVYPLWLSLHYYKTDDMGQARSYANVVRSSDWRLGVSQWLDRIKAKRDREFGQPHHGHPSEQA